MKPFNLEEAKAGKPVCTRDGRDVRIVCFDRLVDCSKTGNSNIVFLVKERDFEKICVSYCSGNLVSFTENPLDLFMKSEKKKLYIAVNKIPDGYGNHNTSNASETTDFFNEIIINPPFLRNTEYQLVEVEIDT